MVVCHEQRRSRRSSVITIEKRREMDASGSHDYLFGAAFKRPTLSASQRGGPFMQRSDSKTATSADAPAV